MSTNKNQKPFFKEWLEKLQQESWQLELLISGGAIFAIIETIKYLDNHSSFFEDILQNNVGFLSFTLFFGYFFLYAAIYIFLFNLVIHVLVRSLWIGAIGLRYVSGDIDLESLSYSDKFSNYYRKKIGSFDDYIEKLEDFSSVLFSYTFLLFFILISFLFGMIFFIGFGGVLAENLRGNWIKNSLRYFLLFSYITCGLLVSFDFITLGFLKRIKNKYFSAFYFPIYRFFSTITFSFLWRPMLLNFLDQKYTRRLFLLIIPYFILLSILFQSNYVLQGFYPDFTNASNIEYPKILDAYSFNLNYYDEDRIAFAKNEHEKRIKAVSIPSKKIKSKLAEIFIKGAVGDNYLINKLDSMLIPFEDDGLTNHTISSLKAELNEERLDIKQKNQIQSLKDSITDKQLFNYLKDSLLSNFDLEKKQAFKKNVIKIRSILKEAILVSIDDKRVNPQNITCDFYFHPTAKSKGLLCFFPLDSLNVGRHYFKIGKVIGKKSSIWDKEISLDTTYYTIPFIYENWYRANN